MSMISDAFTSLDSSFCGAKSFNPDPVPQCFGGFNFMELTFEGEGLIYIESVNWMLFDCFDLDLQLQFWSRRMQCSIGHFSMHFTCNLIVLSIKGISELQCNTNCHAPLFVFHLPILRACQLPSL